MLWFNIFSFTVCFVLLVFICPWQDKMIRKTHLKKNQFLYFSVVSKRMLSSSYNMGHNYGFRFS